MRRRRLVAALVLALLAGMILSAIHGRAGRGVDARPATARPPAAASSATSQAAPATAAAQFTGSVGQRGPRVRALQAALAALGYLAAPPDGGFGPATRKAVEAFQRSSGLAASGDADARTAAALLTALERRVDADSAAAAHALAAASSSGRVPAAAALQDRALLERSVRRLHALPPERAAALASVLHGLARNLGGLDASRARTLFSTLALNAAYLAAHAPPPRGTDVHGPDGLVYRSFPPYGLQLHPLASFAALNAAVARGSKADARRLARALLARARPEGGALVWEYEFPFQGPSRWRSGFVQAVAADALARAGALLGERSLRSAAGRALRAIPGRLVLHLGGGLWIREYSSSATPILNAQLQSLLSLRDYAKVTGDAAGRRLAGRLALATRRLLPRFDAGCWSLYSLGGAKASRHYHAYQTQLLRRLAAAMQDPAWARIAARWAHDLRDTASGCPG